MKKKIKKKKKNYDENESAWESFYKTNKQIF